MSHPAHIDRFRVVRLIGSGGMGHVYEAVDPEIQRRVALKVLRRDLLSDNPELLQRLFVEARAANAIGHPGVVQISEAKLLPEGSGYLVMELLEGVTLTQRLRRAGGRLQLAEALPLAIQVATRASRGTTRHDLGPSGCRTAMGSSSPSLRPFPMRLPLAVRRPIRGRATSTTSYVSSCCRCLPALSCRSLPRAGCRAS